MQFTSKLPVADYLSQGWKLVKPSDQKCPKCNKPIIQSPDGDFMYCPLCDLKIVHEQKQENITGQLLLQRYCMLNESCPQKGCFSPLMRSPDKTFVICGECGYKKQIEEIAAPVVQQPLYKHPFQQEIKDVNNTQKDMKNTENTENSTEESTLDLLKQKVSVMAENLFLEENLDQIVQISAAISAVLDVISRIQNL